MVFLAVSKRRRCDRTQTGVSAPGKGATLAIGRWLLASPEWATDHRRGCQPPARHTNNSPPLQGAGLGAGSVTSAAPSGLMVYTRKNGGSHPRL